MLDEFYIEKLVKKKFPYKSRFFPTGIGDDSAVLNLKDSSLVVATKDNQILYLNMYKQVYQPDYMQIQAEFKKSSGNKDALTSSDDESEGPNSKKSLSLIKSVGIHEEVTKEKKHKVNELSKEKEKKEM